MVALTAPKFSAPEEGVIFQVPSTKLLINDQELGTGTLYITEDNVLWGNGVSPTGSAASAVSLLYSTITMHAVQRNPTPAIVMVVDVDLRVPEMPQEIVAGHNDEFDPLELPVTQIRFVPENEEELSQMYLALNQGQALHPGPVNVVIEDDDDEEDQEHYSDGEEVDEGEYEDAEESNAAAEEAAERLEHLNLSYSNGNHTNEDDDDIQPSGR